VRVVTGESGDRIRLMRIGLARIAAVLRAATTVVALVAAVLGGGGLVSWWWLVPAVVIVAGWSAVYAARAWSKGLCSWLIATDLVVATSLCLAIGRLVPAAALAGTANWTALVAGMAVIAAQVAAIPAVGLPGALAVSIGYVLGARLAGSPDGGLPGGVLFASQAVVATAVMAIALRTERAAVRSFTELERAQAEAAIAMARREDERTQLRLVHNGPLTTLTMALHAGRPSEVLQARAAATLQELPQLTRGSDSVSKKAGQVNLNERLAQVMLWYEPRLTIDARLRPCVVQTGIAEAFAAAAAEVLENIVRHAGAQRTKIELADGDAVTVTISDDGSGFDIADASIPGFGLREDVFGRMDAVRGTATVRSAPGAGTVVILRWNRD
jgi:signal transduction histidine kinase